MVTDTPPKRNQTHIAWVFVNLSAGALLGHAAGEANWPRWVVVLILAGVCGFAWFNVSRLPRE